MGAGVRALNVRPYALPPQSYFLAIFSTFIITRACRVRDIRFIKLYECTV